MVEGRKHHVANVSLRSATVCSAYADPYGGSSWLRARAARPDPRRWPLRRARDREFPDRGDNFTGRGVSSMTDCWRDRTADQARDPRARR